MASAVIFDFYGTLAHWADRTASNYATVFAAHGYELSDEVLDAYFARYDGVEHVAHSTSEKVYEKWVRGRLGELTSSCGVDATHQEFVIDALRTSDQGQMVAYPEAASILQRLRQEGLAIGVCSNWGWELDAFLRQVGLHELIDSSVTSARAGARKPHPLIYARSSESLGVNPREVVFVGDSWAPDVEGPRRAGMKAVHVWRQDERSGQSPPELEEGDHRIEDLSGLLGIFGIA